MMSAAKRRAVCRVLIFRSAGSLRLAIKVCIKNGNVYVTSFDRRGHKLAHTSHHASGQRHFKTRGKHIHWTGGVTGQWEPMILKKTRPADLRGREELGSIGWIGDAITRLPLAKGSRRFVEINIPEHLEYDGIVLQPVILRANPVVCLRTGYQEQLGRQLHRSNPAS